MEREALPVACAILYAFDGPALQAILALDSEAALALLRAPEVEALPTTADLHRLRPALVSAGIAHLRRLHARDELPLHRTALLHFVERLGQPLDPARREVIIAACMHHIRAIHDLNLDYMNWADVAWLIEQLHRAAPDLPGPARLTLALFGAYGALRRQEYDRCGEILAETMAAPDCSEAIRAEALVTRGLSAMNQSLYEQAQADFREALGLVGEAGNHPIAGGALINQSWIHNQLYEFRAALDCAQQALARFEAGGDRYGAAYALYSIGNNAIYLGEWALGRQHLERAGAIYEPAGMAARLAMVEWARGFLHQLLGDEPTSEAAYLRALDAADSPEGGNKVIVADTLTELGLLYQMQHRMDAAADAYRRAIELAGELGDTLRKVLLMYRYSLLCRDQGATGAALATLTEAIDLLETLRISTETESVKLRLLGTTQQIYEAMVLLQHAQGDHDLAFAYVERARARAFLDMLARRGADAEFMAGLQHTSVRLPDVQGRLDPATAVLEYYTVGVVRPDDPFLPQVPAENTRLRGYLLTPPGALVFAITAETCVAQAIPFDPNLLLPTPEDLSLHWRLLTEAKLRWLYRALIGPVEEVLAGKRLIHLIPHGPLHDLPFAALQRPDGGYLLGPNGPWLTYAPSATILCACLARSGGAARATLSLGYNGSGATRLRLAELEAGQVAQMTEGHALIGPATKRDELFQRAGQVQHLHIAGHATFVRGDPLGSSLIIGADDQLDARTIMRGLVLSGTLVTINACSSGLSHVASGDELFGILRAFLYAGAASIVGTLQEVDDLAAYILMVSFFENLARGHTTAQALHHAQLRLRSLPYAEVAALVAGRVDAPTAADLLSPFAAAPIPFADPHYWAGFILVGKP